MPALLVTLTILAQPADLAALYTRFRAEQPPLAFTLESDTLVPSLEDPSVTLRQIEGRFVSQLVFGRELVHRVVMLIPTAPERLNDPARRGKVVIVGSIRGDEHLSFLANYAHPIATRLGYPVMLLPNPGEAADRPGREWSIGELWAEGVPQSVENHYFFRLAVPYLDAMDVFADTLGLEREAIRAVIGGHSKRAPSAYVAAAIRPDNVAGVVFMGMEGRWAPRPGSAGEALSAVTLQRRVTARTIYLGATNEDGYSMFNVTENQARLARPWTVSMVPNYRHAAESPQQFAVWRMWVAHLFDGRPVASITEPSHEPTAEGTRFRARIVDPNLIVQARAWYTYCDDAPYWRDLVWYPVVMRPTGQEDWFEGYERGRTPDAWMVEVEDIAGGVHGYVTSCPQKISDLAVAERTSRGSRSRHWAEK